MMIRTETTVVREHTRDYEIITRETVSIVYKIFGITISKRVSVVDNINTEAKKVRKTGFGHKEEE